MTVVELIRALADKNIGRVQASSELRAGLTELGVAVETDSDGHFRLTQAIELLDTAKILSLLQHHERVSLQVVDVIASTNSELINQAGPDTTKATVLAAEYQQAGRGRQDRVWHSPFAGGICMSMAWQLKPAPQFPGTLSLATGVAVVRTLQKMSVQNVRLKWPNDLVFNGSKVGGILCELRQTPSALQIVAGVGLNLRLDPASIQRIRASGGLPPQTIPNADKISRNRFAAALIDSLVDMFLEYSEKGFDTFRQEWNHADVLAGQEVEIDGPSTITGIASGVDKTGALLVRNGDEVQKVYAGEVRVRKL